MHRDADGSGLVGDGAGDGLTNPPGGVGGELEALGVVKLFDRFDKPQVALLNQVQKLHAASDIPLGDADHQPQICLRQALSGRGVALGHPLGQLHLLLGGEQRHPADLL